MGYKPQGYNSVSPYLIIEDAERTLTFLEAVFGATRRRVIERDGGGIMHAEALIDDTVVMMGESPGGPPAHVHLYVPDVDAAFGRAIAAGAGVARPVTEDGDGDRRGGVTDADGTTWWISTDLTAANR